MIILLACSLTDLQNFFMQSLPLETSCLFSMLLNDDIVDIEKTDGIHSFTFVIDEISRLFSQLSVFCINPLNASIGLI